MKKQYFLLLLLALLYSSLPVLGQTQISSGAGYPLVEDGYERAHYFENNNEMLAVKIIGQKVVLQKMNLKDLRQTSIKTYKDFPKDRGLNFSEVKEIGNQYYVFYFLYEPQSKLDELYVRAIDFNTGEFKNEGVKLLTLKTKLRDITYTVSADGTKMVIRFSPEPTKPFDPKFYKLEYYIFDQYLQPVWNKDIDMPYTNIKMEHFQELIDTKGNLYQLRKVYDSPSSDQFQFDLIRIEAVTGTIGISQLTIPYAYRSPMLFERNSGEVACAGIYFTKEGKGRNGVFISEVHRDVRLVDTKLYEFSLEIVNQNIKKSKQKWNIKHPGSAALDQLELKKIVVEQDGSVLVIGEEIYMEDRSRINNSGAGMLVNKDYIYHRDAIVALKINAASQLDWTVKIPKRQMGRLINTLSFSFFQTEKNYCFYFIDNKANNDLSTGRPARFFNGQGILTVYNLNKHSGAAQRTPLVDTENIEGIPLRRLTHSRIVGLKNQSAIAIENYKGKRQDYVVKITWKE